VSFANHHLANNQLHSTLSTTLQVAMGVLQSLQQCDEAALHAKPRRIFAQQSVCANPTCEVWALRPTCLHLPLLLAGGVFVRW